MTVDLSADLFNAASCDGVMQGLCILMKGNEDDAPASIVYCGPIISAPSVAGCLVFMNPVDFELLQKRVLRGRN